MEPAGSARREAVGQGIGLIIGAVFLLSLADALVKYASADVSLWQIYVARAFFAVPILAVLLLITGGSAAIRARSPGWVVVRSMLLVAMWIAYYAALPMMSLAAAATALYTTPLFIAMFSALLIGEPVRPRQWAGIAVGFGGVVVILRPDTDAFSIVIVLPILAAVFYALAAVVTRSRCADERPLVLALGLNVCLFGVGAVATALVALAAPAPAAEAYPFVLGPWTAMAAREWGFMAILAVLMVVISTGVAKAYQSAPAAIIGTFDYAYLPFAVMWSLVIFSDTPDGATVVGMVLIVAAGVLVAGRPVHASRPVVGTST